MERKQPAYERELFDQKLEKARKVGGLTAALAEFATFPHRSELLNKAWQALTRSYGKTPDRVSTVGEFWSPEMAKAVRFLCRSDLAERFPEMLDMLMEGQFSSTWYRRSYRSADLGYHAVRLVRLLGICIHSDYHEGSLSDWLRADHDWVDGFSELLALELRRGNPAFTAPVKEAILGDNSEVLLSRGIINAVVMSGNDELLCALQKLLSAAKLQEGLRQQILESADMGSRETLLRFLRQCLDEDLFRFSSAIRALSTWAGLGLGDARPALAKKCAALACEVLSDEAKIEQYKNSEDNLEAYFALWGQGCREIADTERDVETLLEDPRHYRRVLAWYFVTHSDNDRYSMSVASRHLDERDDELLSWITHNLDFTPGLTHAYSADKKYAGPVPNGSFPDSAAERRALFAKLKDVLLYLGNRSPVFEGNPFPWSSVTPDKGRVVSCMMSLAGYDMDEGLSRGLFDIVSFMSPDQKQGLIAHFLRPHFITEHRLFLRTLLDDRSVYVRERAVKRLSECLLQSDDVDDLCRSLRTKSSSLRKSILTVLKSQNEATLVPAVERLLRSGEENENQAGIELLIGLKDSGSALPQRVEGALAALRARKLSTQTEILLRQLAPAEDEGPGAYTRENGYGLYDPAAVAAYYESIPSAVPETGKRGLMSKLFGGAGDGELYTEKELRALITPEAEFADLLSRMDAVFTRHADYEYQTGFGDGSLQKLLFGDTLSYVLPLPASCGHHQLSEEGAAVEMIPFWEEFSAALGDYGTDPVKYLGLYLLTGFYMGPYSYINPETEAWFLSLEKKGLAPTVYRVVENYKRYKYFADMIRALIRSFEPHELFVPALKVYRSVLAVMGEKNLARIYLKFSERDDRRNDAVAFNHRMPGLWRELIRSLRLSDEDLAVWFPLEYRLETLVGGKTVVRGALSMETYFRAVDLGLIPADVLMAYLTDPTADLPGKVNTLTDPGRFADGRRIFESYPWAQDTVNRFIDRMVTVEEKRGELPTETTPICLAIRNLEGMGHFCRLLAALGKENFYRGYEYSRENTKQAVLSRLLKNCRPAEDDTPEALAALLKETDISDKRLAEAVMYAPRWAGFAEKILGWDGLKCGVWFFHAHINETFSAEKETETALYSPITPQQFNDGAFDRNWFFEAYNRLGEKRFHTLYSAARYITNGSSLHRRSQLYTDAALGRLDGEKLRQEITEKRNQEKLRCYPLLPMEPGDEKEILRRYEFIQKFLKESRQFGAQRRESERKACAAAMENLAGAAGFADVNRLTWQMESAKSEELTAYTEPLEIGGCSVRLVFDESGEASLLTEKNGKALKAPPKELAKNADFLERKEAVKELKEQRRRARESLERAMAEQSEFNAGELRNILRSPVLAPLVNGLLWVSGEAIGLLRSEGDAFLLETPDGQLCPALDSLRPAHPHDLRTAGVWSDWMHVFYERKLVQPFRQVFREYYPLTEDERSERTLSRRYAGHQVQPARTVALLRSRGWTVDYEEGLQKVFYKEDLIVRMFAAADWFSPADIEAPTLETVEFFRRKDGTNVPLEEAPPVLFSETMRDLDLVVSVAHVGGVDPEASHSTVEMRLAIAAELTALLKLTNVSWVGSHARIEGKLARYSVHMGSGVVHAEGCGMIAILPVHSQARGRIFLPFADDDPKTAEIMSKIILLAEDGKIKDPSILSQIG